jgi:PAS domain S-box-containing protein
VQVRLNAILQLQLVHKGPAMNAASEVARHGLMSGLGAPQGPQLPPLPELEWASCIAAARSAILGLHGRERTVDTRAIVQVPPQLIQKWQGIVDLLAEIVRVPAALIMKAEPANMKVFVSSESAGNPYERGELACLNTGLYCETVMQTRKLLLVPNALADQDWNANPDIKLGMISYMGLPVAWPNGDIFGTICVLDNRENDYRELYRKLLFQCREMLQADLKSLQANNELELEVLERTAELRRSERYLAEAQRLSRTGSFGWKVSTGEIYWSEESFRIFGYDKTSSPTGDMVLQRIHPEDLALVKSTVDIASREGKDIDIEHRLLMPDGSVRNIHVVGQALLDDLGELEFNGAVMDITAAKKAEEELHKARTELAHVARLTTLGELTASIAHEVNQPLSGIVTRANAALRWLSGQSPNVEKARETLRQIVDAGHRASDVVASVRAMFKKDTLDKSTVDVNELIRSVLGFAYFDLRHHRVESQVHLGEHVPSIIASGVQLQQVILNLVMNAIEAMSDVEPRVLTIKSEYSQPNRLRVSIADTGCGIDPSHLHRIFDPLFTTKARGMGMGLPICRSIVESHEGRIWVSGGTSGGSIFQIELPTNVTAH